MRTKTDCKVLHELLLMFVLWSLVLMVWWQKHLNFANNQFIANSNFFKFVFFSFPDKFNYIYTLYIINFYLCKNSFSICYIEMKLNTTCWTSGMERHLRKIKFLWVICTQQRFRIAVLGPNRCMLLLLLKLPTFWTNWSSL